MCVCVCVCVCVCEFKSEIFFFFYKFNQRKWGKGRETSAEIIQALCPSALSICVCCMDVCMNSMCVWQLLHVFVTQLARHPVGLGSTVGRSVPFWLCCVCECVSANVCVCVHMCVLTGFTIRQSVLSSPRNSWTGWDPKKRRRTSKKFSLTFISGVALRVKHQQRSCRHCKSCWVVSESVNRRLRLKDLTWEWSIIPRWWSLLPALAMLFKCTVHHFCCLGCLSQNNESKRISLMTSVVWDHGSEKNLSA